MNQSLKFYFDKMLASYFRRKSSGDITQNTLESAVRNIERLELYWAKRTLADLTTDEWDNYQDWQDKKHPGENRFNECKFLNNFVRKLHNEGIIPRRPEMKNRNAKTDELRRASRNDRIFTKDELQILLHEPSIRQYKRDMFIMGYQCAMRFSECAALTWGRVELVGQNGAGPNILFNPRDHKTNKKQWIPISEPALIMLKRRKILGGEFVFTTNYDKRPTAGSINFRKILKQYEIETTNNHNTRFHSLRRTKISDLFRNPSLSDAVIENGFRTKRATAMKHYFQLSDEDRQLLREAA